MSALTLVVGGAPALATALQSTGKFAAVHPVATTGELRQLVGSGTLPGDPSGLVFLFADNLHSDLPQLTLETLVSKLAGSGRKVILLDLTSAGRQIVSANRQAGLLTGPFTLNATLGALAGLGLAVPPVESDMAFAQFDPVAGPAPQPQQQPQQESGDQGGWPDVSPQPANDAGGWNTLQPAESPDATPQPQPPQSPAAQEPANQWPQQPQDPAGGQSGWPSVPDAAESSQAEQAPVQQQQAPSPQGGMSLAQAAQMSRSEKPATQVTTPDWQDASGWAAAATETAAPAGPAPRGGVPVQHAPGRQRLGRVITVSTPKGGTGKTSLSLNLAAFLGMQVRAEGKTVALIDANYGQADIGKLLDVYSPNITELARDPQKVSVDLIAQSMVHRPELNLSLMLGPASPGEANPVYITPQLYNNVLDSLQQLYDYIIIDTQVAERFSSMHSDFSIPRADKLLVPVNPNHITLMNADTWLREICRPKHSGGIAFDDEKVGIILNMAMEGVECDVEDVMQELGSWSFVGAIPMTPVWQLAINRGEVVATYSYEELNQAFANILYATTGEQALLSSTSVVADSGATGLRGKLTSWLSKRSA